MKTLLRPNEYGYVQRDNLCLFVSGPLSNWYGGREPGENGSFEYQGVTYNCVEQYMMAHKAIISNDEDTLKQIMSTSSAKEQKELGRKVKNFNSKLWDEVKFGIVGLGVHLKFLQNSDLRSWLIDNFNRDTIFAEAAPWDSVWGIGLSRHDPLSWNINTWKGTNLLGEIITRVNKSFHDETQTFFHGIYDFSDET